MNDSQEHLQEPLPDLPLTKVKGVEHEPFLNRIRTRPCLLAETPSKKVGCCSLPAEPHHVRGRKHGDIANVVPLCRVHHTEGHKIGWATWQKKHGINLLERAAWYWWRFCERSESDA